MQGKEEEEEEEAAAAIDEEMPSRAFDLSPKRHELNLREL